jgi:MFS family permease
VSKHTTNRTRWRDRFKRPARPSAPAAAEPWWVKAFPDVGRPLVTVIVLVMCAPGEHKLGVMAGYSTRLAWGMAAVLALYAGIAAVVAGRRRKGEPGRVTAVVGAIGALLLGMAAQPIAHLYVTGVWVARPHDQVWLIVGASCVPALVLAHLLHLAASHRPAAPAAEDVEQLPAEDVEQPPADDVDQEPAELSPYAAEVWVTVTRAAEMVGRSESTVRGWMTDPERGIRTRPADDGSRRVLIDASTLPAVQLKLASG